jgi:uncharacterized protein YbaR (Trm112 family)
MSDVVLDEELFAGAIVFCPICVTNVDVDEEGWIELYCNNCGTEFKVNVIREVVRLHSTVG